MAGSHDLRMRRVGEHHRHVYPLSGSYGLYSEGHEMAEEFGSWWHCCQWSHHLLDDGHRRGLAGKSW